MSGVIGDRGGATAVSELPAADGAWLDLLARVRGRQISKPQKKNTNRQQKYSTTSDVVPVIT
jgi:hypothetical protein